MNYREALDSLVKLPPKDLLIERLLLVNDSPEAREYLYELFLQIADKEMTVAQIVHFVSDQQCAQLKPERFLKSQKGLLAVLWAKSEGYLDAIILDPFLADKAKDLLCTLDWY